MNGIKYTCTIDSRDSLHVVERDMDRLSFMTEREGNWTGSAWVTPEAIADLARRLAEHVGLTIEPEPFKRDAKFEDIRKGDLVRVEYTQNDITVVRTGVADDLLSSGWYTPTRELLFGPNFGDTITILSRPEPEPEPELPTTPGAVIKLWLGEEWMRVNLGADGYWRGEWPDGDGMEVTRVELAGQCGIGWDRFEVLA
ncbi:hypothetical protein [Galactobacter caseinivorans]|uniref:Uncharacterized protein n=1 Tax=Galactobacter caseinivorans TaxID=2676123 RepID=A0A496PMY4_9MICC|nr:hypothetical protein [Galactobacter caseinivorans]RKW71784.1 hypothetical protein DWQ67_02850 [Galactobacter caseinivorans]